MIRTKVNIRLIVIGSLWLILSSCAGNSICFDINKQSVNSCNRKIIRTLCITSEDGKDYFFFTLISGKEGKNELSLLKLDLDYALENMYGKISLDSFKLRSNTTYEIENSTVGDASSSKILVKTNEKGVIVYSNVTTCK